MRISGPSIRKSTGAHFRPVGTEPSHLCGAGVPCVPAERDSFFKTALCKPRSASKKASIGPYARLRAGTSLGEGVRIGNFVETKAATLEAGVKVNHLSYVGDAYVGANSNLELRCTFNS
ncbi:NDP-sugar pyrophosphorylase family protein [Bradyrhizobium sp. AZCC 1578]